MPLKEKACIQESTISDTKVKSNINSQSFQLSEPLYSLKDMILPTSTSDEILTVIDASNCWNKVFVEWGLESTIKQRKSILVNLYGESGTGKTMAAHAIANEIGKKLVCVNYADIESKYVGETGKNLAAIFSFAQANNAILFFDEADALLSKRVTNMSNATDVSVNQTRSVLLTLMNNYEGMIIFTTNFISNYDSAFMRRIQYHIFFDLPDVELRKNLWRKYIPDKMPTDADIDNLAVNFKNVSGSDISNAVLKAALKAARLDNNIVSSNYFEEAITSIIRSKSENSTNCSYKTTVEKRTVSEEYALAQINGKEAAV